MAPAERGVVPRRLPRAGGRAHVRPRAGDGREDLPGGAGDQRRGGDGRGVIQGQGKEQVRRGGCLNQPKLQP